MNIDTTSGSPLTLVQRQAHEAANALHATTDEAKRHNTEQLAALSDGVTEAHRAEHIRAVVATNIAHLSIEASDVTRAQAQQWGRWALDVADGVERGQPAAV